MGRIVGAAAGAVIITAAIAAVKMGSGEHWGSGGAWPSHGTLVSRSGTFVDLDAERDMGALSDMGTADGQWCQDSPEWCVSLQTSAATDFGSFNKPLVDGVGARHGVETYIPTSDATGWASFTGEAASWYDNLSGARSAMATSQAWPATDLFTFSVVFTSAPDSDTQYLVYALANGGWNLYIDNLGRVVALVRDKSVNAKTAIANTTVDDSAWHCMTIVFDGRSSNAATGWIDGVGIDWLTTDLNTPDTWDGASNPKVGGANSTTSLNGAIARIRYDSQDALTRAEHLELCGTMWRSNAGGATDTQPLLADISWTQTGNARCYPTGATSAVCSPGGASPYVVDATGIGWAVDLTAVNRLTYTSPTEITCSSWTCSTATIDATLAPDGGKGAAAITMGGGYIEHAATGYTVATTLHGNVWAKCSAGTLTIAHQGGTGSWTVNCTTVGGAWTLLRPEHAAVTVGAAFQSDGSGGLTLRFSGTNAEIWIPTWTEQHSANGMVIPVNGTTITSTGDPVWAIDNSGGGYYVTGDTVTQTLTEHTGTCFAVGGSDVWMTGASTCSAAWYALQVSR